MFIFCILLQIIDCKNFIQMNQTEPEDTSDERFLTKPLIIIYMTVFIDLVGFGIVIPLLPYYGETFAASPFEIEMLFAVYSAMQFIFAPILGALSDRYGRRPILFISLIGSAFGYVVIGYATVLWMVFVGRIIAGITGGNISTAQAYIADVTSKEDRAKGMGLFGAMFGLGFIFGPAIGGILSRYGIHVPFLFAAILTFANALALYFILPETRTKEVRQAPKPKTNRFAETFAALADRRFSIITTIYFLIVTSFSIMTASFTLFTMYRFEYTAFQNGLIFTYIGALAIFLQGFLFNRLVRKFSEPPLVVVGCFLLVGSFFAVPYIGPDSGGLTALLIGVAFFAIGNSLSSPALTSLASKISDQESQGKALGVMQSSASLARAVGPTIGAVLMNNAVDKIDDSTIQRTFWVASAIMLVSLFVAFYSAKLIQDNP